MESINRDRRATRDDDDDDDGETASSPLDSHIYLMDSTFAWGIESALSLVSGFFSISAARYRVKSQFLLSKLLINIDCYRFSHNSSRPRGTNIIRTN